MTSPTNSSGSAPTTKATIKDYAAGKIDEGRRAVTGEMTENAINGALYELVSPNPDKGSLAKHGAALLGSAAASRLAEKLKEKLLGGIDKHGSHGQLDPLQQHRKDMVEGMERAERLSKPDIGISGCMDAGKALKAKGVTGVTGEICAGVGAGSGHGLNGKGVGAGVTVRLQF